ncbi:MAG: hypothetical protein H6581_28855 [Bacteroidia bacterium]|nr:hypothetical protein [Bacteroidia bacterium]
MKKLISIFSLILLVGSSSFAQKVWTEPADNIDPADTLKIYVDLTKMDCDKLVGNPGPLYIWTWMPGDPVNGNGSWNASNTDNAWTNVGPDIWRFTMIPTEFYGVPAQDVYDKDIFFLVKALDGGSGGDCSSAGLENKTEDLTVAVDPPVAPNLKVKSFPAADGDDIVYITQKDIFSLRYDNNEEEKVSMQNVSDLFVYARAYDTTGTEYKPALLSQVGNNPKLQMRNNGDGTFTWSIQPAKVFNIPDTQVLDYVKLQIMKPKLTNSNDAVDGEFVYYFRCQ